MTPTQHHFVIINDQRFERTAAYPFEVEQFPHLYGFSKDPRRWSVEAARNDADFFRQESEAMERLTRMFEGFAWFGLNMFPPGPVRHWKPHIARSTLATIYRALGKDGCYHHPASSPLVVFLGAKFEKKEIMGKPPCPYPHIVVPHPGLANRGWTPELEETTRARIIALVAKSSPLILI